jgi:predicted nucleic acid-binding protein
MSVPAFLDTNVLVYADDRANPEKRDRAQALIREVVQNGNGHLSLQVLQEYFAAATRKLGMDAAAARQRVELYAQINVVILDPEDLLVAIDLHRRYSISIWDALIIRAAILGGCRKLYTEDLQQGFFIERLEIVNPFA